MEPNDPPRRTHRTVLAFVAAAVATQLLTSCTLVPDAAGPAGSTPTKSVAAQTRPDSAEGPYRVVSVSDGDTIKVSIDGRLTTVRLIGIDTPEVTDPRKPVQCFGREASQRAHELLGDAEVWLEYDPSQSRLDRYGRTLAYVWLGGALINQAMVSEGFAHEYTYDTAYKYQDEFNAAEHTASQEQRGLWSPSTCAGDTERSAG